MFNFENEEDKQRFKNFILYKFYGTDKELEEAAPTFFGLFLLIVF